MSTGCMALCNIQWTLQLHRLQSKGFHHCHTPQLTIFMPDSSPSPSSLELTIYHTLLPPTITSTSPCTELHELQYPQLICNLYIIYIASVCCARIKMYSSTWTRCCIESLLITPSAMPTNITLTSKINVFGTAWINTTCTVGALCYKFSTYICMHASFALPSPPPPPPSSFSHALLVFQFSSK